MKKQAVLWVVEFRMGLPGDYFWVRYLNTHPNRSEARIRARRHRLCGDATRVSKYIRES